MMQFCLLFWMESVIWWSGLSTKTIWKRIFHHSKQKKLLSILCCMTSPSLLYLPHLLWQKKKSFRQTILRSAQKVFLAYYLLIISEKT